MVKEICTKPWRQCCGGGFSKAPFVISKVYITTDGEIKANDLAQGQRYVVDLTGYYVYGG